MSVKDRVSTAAEATAASVRHIRPLTLPEGSADLTEPHGHRRRTFTRVRNNWLVPLAAAAVVAALALGQVALRHAEHSGTAPADTSATAGIPRYFAVATEGPVGHLGRVAVISVAIGDVDSGKTIAAVALPPISVSAQVNAAVGVSAAGDDRTFVVGRRDAAGDTDFFQVRIAPGTSRVATVTHLRIPEMAYGDLLGFAVSPDGEKLAVASVRGNGTTLRVYSVASGATLRTWTAGTWKTPAYVDQFPGVSWTADSRQVAFSTPVATRRTTAGGLPLGALVERLIAVSAPSGDLAFRSKVALRAPDACWSLLLTADGGEVVCGTLVGADLANISAADCEKTHELFVVYSATGRRLRTLYQYPGACGLSGLVLWTDDSARHVVVERQLHLPTSYTDEYGVITGEKFTRLPVPPPGESYSGPAF